MYPRTASDGSTLATRTSMPRARGRLRETDRRHFRVRERNARDGRVVGLRVVPSNDTGANVFHGGCASLVVICRQRYTVHDSPAAITVGFFRHVSKPPAHHDFTRAAYSSGASCSL